MIKPLSNIILKALPSNKKGIIGAQVEVDGVCYHDKLDVCDEELYVYLLDSQTKKIVDYVIIGGKDDGLTPSIFKVGEIEILSDDTISFKFMSPNGSDGWVIKLFSKPVKSLPSALKYPLLVTCPVSLKRYFQVYPKIPIK